jgi:hypothetical protein
MKYTELKDLSEILKLNDSEFSELKNEIESHLMNLEND